MLAVALPTESPAQAAGSYRLAGLTRRFPGVLAVDRVDLTVRRGEIHGIIGRNGAGKSVLVSMIAGLIPPSAGTVLAGGGQLDAENATPVRAHRLGISLIPQEPRFARALTVTDNLFIGRELTVGPGFLDPAAMRRAVAEVIDRLELEASPTSRMGDLPIETQQLLAFGKAVFIEHARIILLDEITASLSRQRKTRLLGLLRTLAAESADLSFTLISHHIAEVMEFTDRVTVMRDGRVVAMRATAKTDERSLANWIVGDVRITGTAQAAKPAAKPRAAAMPLLMADRLGDGRDFHDLSFQLQRGEVIGFAGLEGSGKDAALEALFGLRPLRTGEVRLEGSPVRFAAPREALKAGIAFLPKHREVQAVIQNRPVEDNTLISSLRRIQGPLGFLRVHEGQRIAREKTAELQVKTPSIFTPIDHLSGGNKQKILINRLSLTVPKVFLLNEPTRGVDLAAKPALLQVVRDRQAAQSGVIMLSESEDELVACCDRVLVFFRGRITRVLERGKADFTVGEIYKSVQGVEEP